MQWSLEYVADIDRTLTMTLTDGSTSPLHYNVVSAYGLLRYAPCDRCVDANRANRDPHDGRTTRAIAELPTDRRSTKLHGDFGMQSKIVS